MPAKTEVKTGFFLMIGIIAALVVVSIAAGIFKSAASAA